MKKYLLSTVVIVTFLIYSASTKVKTLPISQIDVGNNISPTPTSASVEPTISGGKYKDGDYIGSVEDAFYGNIQVAAAVQSGKLTQVRILQYPNDRGTSIEINSQALPILQSEAITAQNATVDIVSGATDSSRAFIRSLGSALSKALN